MNPKFDILIVSLFRIMYQSNYDALIELLWEEEKIKYRRILFNI